MSHTTHRRFAPELVPGLAFCLAMASGSAAARPAQLATAEATRVAEPSVVVTLVRWPYT